MKIIGGWIAAEPTQRVCAALTGAGFRALFVGGCVRNALLGVPVADIDIASDAAPGDVSRLAERAGLKVVPTVICALALPVSGILVLCILLLKKPVVKFSTASFFH